MPGESLDARGDLSVPESQLLSHSWKQQHNLAGVKWEQVKNSMNKRIRPIHFVPADSIEQLLAEADFSGFSVSFRIYAGGWMAFKG